MKKSSFLIILIVLTTSIFSQKINDADAELRVIQPFHGINVEDAFDVFISQSKDEVVAVSASEKEKTHIITEVKDGVLHVRMDAKGVSILWGNKKRRVYISFKELDRIIIKGACNVFVAGNLQLTELSIQLSGASDFKASQGVIDIKKLGVSISGASDMLLSGKVNTLYIDATGASKFRGFDLLTDVCDIKGSGASDIKITVSKELHADVSGATAVKYKGECTLRNVKTTGSSNFSKG